MLYQASCLWPSMVVRSWLVRAESGPSVFTRIRCNPSRFATLLQPCRWCRIPYDERDDSLVQAPSYLNAVLPSSCLGTQLGVPTQGQLSFLSVDNAHTAALRVVLWFGLIPDLPPGRDFSLRLLWPCGSTVSGCRNTARWWGGSSLESRGIRLHPDSKRCKSVVRETPVTESPGIW